MEEVFVMAEEADRPPDDWGRPWPAVPWRKKRKRQGHEAQRGVPAGAGSQRRKAG